MGHVCFAQKLDTIFVNKSRTTYVLCHDSIVYFEVGSKQYTGLVKGDAFFLKPLMENAEPTSLLIKTASSYINKVVAYSFDEKKKYLYDLQGGNIGGKETNKASKAAQNSNNENNITKDSTTESNVDHAALDKKLTAFMSIVSPYKTITVQKERIVFSMGNIKITGPNLFVKLSLSNFSQHRFIIDKITMVYLNQAGDLLGASTELENHLDFLHQSKTAPYADFKETKQYGFVTDAAKLKGKGKLIILLTESNSTRVYQLEVPSSLFIKN